jgi:Mlc titration factor MtfA (ptsG expression regulator)
MFAAFRGWRRKRILRRHSIPDELWESVASRYGFAVRLNEDELARLRDCCILFMHEKQITAAGGLELDAEMKLGIAVQACIPILNLGLDFYRDWVELIVYPDEFVPGHEYHNEHGLVQRDQYAYAGQAWLRGPVILSWTNVAAGSRDDGVNVVIHECVHKIDMLNGDANGYPPLHADMNRQKWSEDFGAAYENLCRQVDEGQVTELDAYACESPAEFFAVASEMFFEQPGILASTEPRIYSQLTLFFRQTPLSAGTVWPGGQKP